MNARSLDLSRQNDSLTAKQAEDYYIYLVMTGDNL
jgi:hypothetical protein